MAIRSDSYGSVAEVLAYTRHLLDGAETFDEATHPTLAEVERIIDRVSGTLNVALAGEGLTTPVTNSTAKLICSDWVVTRAVNFVESTRLAVGASDQASGRSRFFIESHNAAADFARVYRRAFQRVGVGVSSAVSQGLQFTGLDAVADRSDPDDTSLEQPLFERGKFGAYDDTSEETA